MNTNLKLTARRIRVYGKSAAHYQQRPWVTMTGLWLENADFKPGDYVDIQVEEGKLTLTRTPWKSRNPPQPNAAGK